ncbi:MAG: hypothetical protein ABIF88_00315 [archaeon]
MVEKTKSVEKEVKKTEKMEEKKVETVKKKDKKVKNIKEVDKKINELKIELLKQTHKRKNIKKEIARILTMENKTKSGEAQ